MEYVKRYGRRFGAAAVLAAAVAVSGCGQAPAAPPDASPATSGAATGATREPAPQDVLVEVGVSGGFAGVGNKLVVHYDGAYTVRHGTKPPVPGRLTPAQAAELRAALEDPAYAKVPERSTGDSVRDGFTYEVTYGHRLVVTQDGAARPPALQRVFDALPGGGPPTAP
ncbi:hypothetical protein ACFYU9_28725 [Streptomyces sp. NPDC004327]|uniref:hypothetical protein n=1 Tax=Streptomyces sp. NPDC004327 TaxID=3364699 RepID=UPI0036D1F529